MDIALWRHHFNLFEARRLQPARQYHMSIESSIAQFVDRRKDHSHLKADARFCWSNFCWSAFLHKGTELFVKRNRTRRLAPQKRCDGMVATRVRHVRSNELPPTLRTCPKRARSYGCASHDTVPASISDQPLCRTSVDLRVSVVRFGPSCQRNHRDTEIHRGVMLRLYFGCGTFEAAPALYHDQFQLSIPPSPARLCTNQVCLGWFR